MLSVLRSAFLYIFISICVRLAQLFFFALALLLLFVCLVLLFPSLSFSSFYRLNMFVEELEEIPSAMMIIGIACGFALYIYGEHLCTHDVIVNRKTAKSRYRFVLTALVFLGEISHGTP